MHMTVVLTNLLLLLLLCWTVARSAGRFSREFGPRGMCRDEWHLDRSPCVSGW
ncbi:hypothetical protein Mapa_015233 [Marchantia paleacea]|nr:hypothetical protein Mapa_015233 [Marchantia paleacea]